MAKKINTKPKGDGREMNKKIKNVKSISRKTRISVRNFLTAVISFTQTVSFSGKSIRKISRYLFKETKN